MASPPPALVGIAAVLLGYDTGHLVWAGSGKTLIFETTVDSLVDSLVDLAEPSELV